MIETKHTLITEELKQRILDGYYTAKLPPMRQLMQEFNVSMQTMNKAVKPLSAGGFILPGPRGSVINVTREKRIRHYAWGKLCSCITYDEETVKLLQQLSQQLDTDKNHIVFLDNRNERLQHDPDFWKNCPIDGLIIGFRTLTVNLVRKVTEAGIAAIAQHHAGALPVHVVEYDTFGAIDRVVGELHRAGYRRIALQFFQPLVGYQEFAVIQWRNIRKKYNIDFPEYEQLSIPGTKSPVEEHTALLCSNHPPEALLCWHTAPDQAANWLRQQGLSPQVNLASYAPLTVEYERFMLLSSPPQEEYWRIMSEVLKETMDRHPSELIHRIVPYHVSFVDDILPKN